mmetsp:Transcript_29125/g.30256  ORF Transcript_29125/g.30256 Transcript_29125/m.30256 type:complete len:261 (-) Transcript_29125:40-822(-)
MEMNKRRSSISSINSLLLNSSGENMPSQSGGVVLFELNDKQIDVFKCELCDEHLRVRLKELSYLLKLMIKYTEMNLRKFGDLNLNASIQNLNTGSSNNIANNTSSNLIGVNSNPRNINNETSTQNLVKKEKFQYSNQNPQSYLDFKANIESIKNYWSLINKLILLRQRTVIKCKHKESEDNIGVSGVMSNANKVNNKDSIYVLSSRVQIEAKQEDLKEYFIEIRNRSRLLSEYTVLIGKFEEIGKKVKEYLEKYYIEKES